MTSGGVGFPAAVIKPSALLQDGTHPQLLVVDHSAPYISSSNVPSSCHPPSSHSPVIDNLSGVGTGFDSLGLISRPGTIPAPSPRIEITPSGDSLNSQRLEPSPSCKALGPYRETTPCVSPASSNSSTGWAGDSCSPLASPCVSPCGAGCGMGLSALDLGAGPQGVHSSSAHSSPGASPHTSITDEFLLPQHQRTTSPLPTSAPLTLSPGKASLSMAPLPSLEWTLPSQSSQYDLLIQEQPRSHHRAHYETEGSRGAVKTPLGGHPEVQLLGYQGTAPLSLQVFIGTADERPLKPHAFYQVHRITGKTVTTPSMERMINGTKVLEIPLEPKNHMRAVIDCAGILKLRNAALKKTLFVSLQVASHPIECCKDSLIFIFQIICNIPPCASHVSCFSVVCQ
uniref:RHD domain-containing protein n=1 Tax=Myripristis murdjan TaxID=586833 RepID=A0A668A6D9_9TELE